jgi:hypothetical protein
VFRRAGAHEELTDPKNERILGTLTPRSWAKLAVLDARSKFYNAELEPEEIVHPMEGLIRTAIQSSGSIRGEHRKDLVDAIKGASPQTVGLSVGQAPGAAASAPVAEKKRGL